MKIELHKRIGRLLKEVHVLVLYHAKADKLIVSAKYKLEDILLHEQNPSESNSFWRNIYAGPLQESIEPETYPSSERKQEIVSLVDEIRETLTHNYHPLHIEGIIDLLDKAKKLIVAWPSKIPGLPKENF